MKYFYKKRKCVLIEFLIAKLLSSIKLQMIINYMFNKAKLITCQDYSSTKFNKVVISTTSSLNPCHYYFLKDTFNLHLLKDANQRSTKFFYKRHKCLLCELLSALVSPSCIKFQMVIHLKFNADKEKALYMRVSHLIFIMRMIHIIALCIALA